MLAPRLTLLTPFRWLRDDKTHYLKEKLKLTSQRIDFPLRRFFLDRADFITCQCVKVNLLFRFNMKGELNAKPNIGPITRLIHAGMVKG